MMVHTVIQYVDETIKDNTGSRSDINCSSQLINLSERAFNRRFLIDFPFFFFIRFIIIIVPNCSLLFDDELIKTEYTKICSPISDCRIIISTLKTSLFVLFSMMVIVISIWLNIMMGHYSCFQNSLIWIIILIIILFLILPVIT